MKLGRFVKDHKIFYGAVSEDAVQEIAGDIFGTYQVLDVRFPLNTLTVLAPCAPSKIVAVGLNYRTHAAGSQNGTAAGADTLSEAVHGGHRSGGKYYIPCHGKTG